MKNNNQPVFQTLLPFVLASASPRRRELLAGLGLDFTIRVVDGAEPAAGANDVPEVYVMHAAKAKAEAVARVISHENAPASVVLGADTVVVLHEPGGPVILGKPANNKEALAMLLHLAGREHSVYTGCCLILPHA
ncbi:MAG: Maf family protein, partial [Bilophila sp.]